MRKVRRFGVDVDGVIGNFTGSFLTIANRICGTSYKPEDINAWDLEFLPEVKAKSTQIWDEVGDAGFARGLEVYPGAVEGLRRLHELGEVFIVTSPVWMQNELMDDAEGVAGARRRGLLHGQTFCYDRVRWLEEHFGIDRKHVIFAYHKHVIEFDGFIDDKLSNVEHWIAEHGSKRGTKAVLWAQKYNLEGDGCHPKVLRTDSWDVALEYLKEGGRKPKRST